MKHANTSWYRRVVMQLALGTLVVLLGTPALRAAALPPDAELTIPKEDGFDELDLSLEEINQVKLYNRYPSSWEVHDLTDGWRGQPLAEPQSSRLDSLDEAFLKKSTSELLKTDPLNLTARNLQPKVPTLYVSKFTLDKPLDPKRSSARLFFENCPKGVLYVNYQKAAEWGGGWFAYDVDITRFVKQGENVLAYAVYEWPLTSENQLVIGPPVYVKRLLLNPRIPANILDLELLLTNNHPEAVTTVLKALIKPYRGAGATTSASLSKRLELGENGFTWEIKMEKPVYWSPENPYLYEIEFRDGRGRALGKERFGFRSFHTDGKHFYLNGKRIFLYGVQWTSFGGNRSHSISFIDPLKPGEHELTRGKRFHYGWFKALKMAGVNCVRPHSATDIRGRELYEAADEVGILHYDEGMNMHQWADKRVDNPKEHMAPFARYAGRYLYSGYNHPSTVMYSFGNECYGARSENVNVVYDYLRSLDKQGRPMCPSSGRLWQGLHSKPREKRDFQDDHSYYGTMKGSWLYNRAYFRDVKKQVEAVYGVDATPIVNFECIAVPDMRYDHNALTRRAYRMAMSDPADKKEHIKLLTLPAQKNWGWDVVMRAVVAREGLRTRYTDEVTAWEYAAEVWRRQIEMFRQEGILQGIGPHMAAKFVQFLGNEPWHNRNTLGYGLLAGLKDQTTKARLGMDWNTKKRRFIATPGFYAMKRCYSPELISAQWFDRNLIAGSGAIKTAIYLVKDTNDSHSYAARVLFRDQAGKVIHGKTIDFGKLDGFARVTREYQYSIPGNLLTGEYRLELYLFRDGKRVADNYYIVRVFGKNQAKPDIQSAKKVGVYLSTDAKASDATRAMLDAMGLKFEEIKDLANLSGYKVLIIGPHSLNEHVDQHGGPIREWIKAGGRLLAFHQSRPGPLPWLPEMEVLKAESVELANIMDPRHPALRGLAGKHFDTWSGDGRLSGCFLAPLNETSVMIAPYGYVMRAGYAKPVLADVAQGRGISVMSQFEVSRRYGTDGVATALANNLVRYIVSDERGYSYTMKGEKAAIQKDADKKESDWK